MISGKIIIKMHPNVTQEMLQKLDWGLEDFAEAILTKSQELVPVNNGMLKKSGEPPQGGIKSEFLKKTVEYNSPYALYVEYGTNPHYISKEGIEEIVKWAKRKLGVNDKEARQAAYGIAGKIAALGSEAQPFLRPAADFVIPHIPEIFKRAMR